MARSVTVPEIRTIIYLHDEVKLSWTAIALVMKEYHGIERSKGAWRQAAKRNGVLPGRRRGVPIDLQSNRIMEVV